MLVNANFSGDKPSDSGLYERTPNYLVTEVVENEQKVYCRCLTCIKNFFLFLDTSAVIISRLCLFSKICSIYENCKLTKKTLYVSDF